MSVSWGSLIFVEIFVPIQKVVNHPAEAIRP